LHWFGSHSEPAEAGSLTFPDEHIILRRQVLCRGRNDGFGPDYDLLFPFQSGTYFRFAHKIYWTLSDDVGDGR
jgi:hypothetical protein